MPMETKLLQAYGKNTDADASEERINNYEEDFTEIKWRGSGRSREVRI